MTVDTEGVAARGRQRVASGAGTDDPSLPPEVERLLRDVVADGFVLYCCGPKTQPRALVASYVWEHYVDLVTIRSFDRITTARIPARGTVDVFGPDTVVWAYEGPPQQALRALLNLPHPQHPSAPTVAYPAPPSLHISRAEQRPLTIRPPSPHQATARAARLAAAMATNGLARQITVVDTRVAPRR